MTLTVIRIEVNANSLTFTLPKQGLDELLEEIQSFATLSKGKGNSRKLCQWQKLAGWMNWSFNVFPMIRPALNNVYPKIAGKEKPLMRIWVNNAVWDDLQWAFAQLWDSLGIRLLSSVSWEAGDADETVFCDACQSGLGFWFPS